MSLQKIKTQHKNRFGSAPANHPGHLFAANSTANSTATQGATMLEFAFALPVLVLVVFAIVDFSRYYAVTAVLNSAADEALNRARKIPNFDYDFRGAATTAKEYERFNEARNIILDTAERSPLETLLKAEGSGADAVLKNITSTDNGLTLPNGTPAPTVVRGAAVLRPGECAEIAGEGPICNGPQGTTTAPAELMDQHPIRVILRAEIRPYLPFIGTLAASGEAYGYREKVPTGPLAGPLDAEDIAELGPVASPTPIFPAGGEKEEEPPLVSCCGRDKFLLNLCLAQSIGAVCIFVDSPLGTNDCRCRAVTLPEAIQQGFVKGVGF